MCVCWSLSHVRLFVTPRSVACKPPLSLGFSSQEYWSGLPFPSPRDLPNPGIKLRSPAADKLWWMGINQKQQIFLQNRMWICKDQRGSLVSRLRSRTSVRTFGSNSSSFMGFPGGTSGKEPTCQCRRPKRHRFYPWVWKTPWRRAWQPTLVFLPGESHGQRSLVDNSP